MVPTLGPLPAACASWASANTALSDPAGTQQKEVGEAGGRWTLLQHRHLLGPPLLPRLMPMPTPPADATAHAAAADPR